MVKQTGNPSNPALSLFPLFDTYEEMVATELEGLTDAQLDWTSDRWGWSEWSIRNNVSHVYPVLRVHRRAAARAGLSGPDRPGCRAGGR